jgi:hypothetical protein
MRSSYIRGVYTARAFATSEQGKIARAELAATFQK